MSARIHIFLFRLGKARLRQSACVAVKMLALVCVAGYGSVMQAKVAHYLKALLIAGLMIGLAAVAFGHKPAFKRADADLLEFIQVNGSLDGICGDPELASGGECPACQIVKSFALTGLDTGEPQAVTQAVERLKIIAQVRHRARPLDPARLSRAPPLA